MDDQEKGDAGMREREMYGNSLFSFARRHIVPVLDTIKIISLLQIK